MTIPNKRTRILGPDGRDMKHRWEPKGFVQPMNKPQKVVNLSQGNKAADHYHAQSEEELAIERESGDTTWYRCPICAAPYKDEKSMKDCLKQSKNTTVRDALENNGWEIGSTVEFVADNMAEGKRRQRITSHGTLESWMYMRTPRGHEEAPRVKWHPDPGSFLGGVVPDDELWTSLLVCVGTEDRDGVMTALPWFTRKPDDRRGDL